MFIGVQLRFITRYLLKKISFVVAKCTFSAFQKKADVLGRRGFLIS